MWQPTLLGIAAIVSAIGGAISTIYAIRKGRREEAESYVEKLRECREEAEALGAELHRLKMRYHVGTESEQDAGEP